MDDHRQLRVLFWRAMLGGVVGVGIDINATHTGSATEGIVTAVCTPIHSGRSLAVHEIVITAEDGRRCSTVRITNFYKPIK